MRRSLKNDSDGEEIDTHKITREKDFHSDVECADKQHSLTQHIYIMSEVEMEKMKMVFFKKKL